MSQRLVLVSVERVEEEEKKKVEFVWICDACVWFSLCVFHSILTFSKHSCDSVNILARTNTFGR